MKQFGIPDITMSCLINAPVEDMPDPDSKSGATKRMSVQYHFDGSMFQKVVRPERSASGTPWIPVGEKIESLPAGFTSSSTTVQSNIAGELKSAEFDEFLYETAKKLQRAIPALNHLTLGFPSTNNMGTRQVVLSSRIKATDLNTRLDAMLAGLAPAGA